MTVRQVVPSPEHQVCPMLKSLRVKLQADMVRVASAGSQELAQSGLHSVPVNRFLCFPGPQVSAQNESCRFSEAIICGVSIVA